MTIIIMLILAGVTIVIISGDNGMMNVSKRSVLDADIARWQEKLEVAKATTQLKDLDKFSKEEYFDIIEKEKTIKDKNNDVEKNEDSTYEVTTTPGYIFEIKFFPNEEKTNDVKITYIGEKGRMLPRIKNLEITNKSTNSISVKLTVKNLDDGEISYYYKKQDEKEYKKLEGKQNVTDLTAEYKGLNQNTIYNIKVVAQNKNGKEEKEINVKTLEVGGAEDGLTHGKLTASSLNWNQDSHTASVILSTTESNTYIQYQIGGIDGKWETAQQKGENLVVSGLNHNDNLYARLWDGTNGGTPAYITVRDGQGPTITVSTGTITSNSIVVNVSASDNEWGMPSPVSYTVTVGSQTKTGTGTSYTFTGLTQDTNYSITASAKDKAENTGTGTGSAKTSKVTGASSGLNTATLKASSPTWSNGKASITLSTNSGLDIQYQIGGISGKWTTGKTVSNLTHNSVVYARLWDGTNGGTPAYITVRDGKEPIIQAGIGYTTDGVAGSLLLSITVNDGETGLNKIIWYYKLSSASQYTSTTDVYTSSGIGSTSIETKTKKLENLNAGSTYNIYAEVYDMAGNKTRSPSSGTKNITLDTAKWKNENTRISYTTLSKAVSSASDKNHITLLASYTDSSQITISKNITINLSDKTLTKSSYPIITNGTVAITGNGTLSTSNITNTGVINNKGKLTIHSGNIKSTSYVAIENHGQLIVNGGTIDSTADNAIWNRNQNSSYNTTSNPAVKITAGTFSTNNTATVISNYGNSMIYITGGTIWHKANGKAFNLAKGYSGSLYVDGATIKTTANPYYANGGTGTTTFKNISR